MRIAVIGQDFPESLSRYVVGNLERMGHESTLFENAAQIVFKNAAIERAARLIIQRAKRVNVAIEKRMARRILEWEPEIVISLDGYLWPPAVELIRKNKTPVVLWFPDALVNVGRQQMFMAPYSRLFLKDPYFVRYCTDVAKLPAAYLPEACDPLVHRPLEPSDDEAADLTCDIAVIGNVAPNRVRIVEQLMEHDIRIWARIWPGWIRSPARERWTGEYLIGDQKAKVMRASKIVLNNLHYGEIESANCRLFEAAGCGGFQLAEWRRSMDDLFEGDSEVVYYRSLDELRELIDHYLPLADERRAIGDKASARAHADHTYEDRLARLIEAST